MSVLVTEAVLRSLPVSDPLSMSLPLTDSSFRSAPVSVPFLMFEPLMVTAAYDVPASAANSAIVAMTLPYVGRGICIGGESPRGLDRR